jgi:Tfp pilus assembly protein PilF
MKTWLILLSWLLLSGCAAPTPRGLPPLSQLFTDAEFGAPTERISADDVFTLSPAMLEYAHSSALARQMRTRGLEQGLLEALYKKGELKLDYDATMTRTAAQAFDARSGNCLSLVIMTAAFAKEFGIDVEYHTVLVDPSWSREGAFYFASSHVNLSLKVGKADRLRGVSATGQSLTVDFLGGSDLDHFHSLSLDEDSIVAMFMNNRAAEALAQDRLADAYWWARAAIERNPSLVIAYNTLGVIYQRHGNSAQAERVFKTALVREPENTTLLQNLVPVLAAIGKPGESLALADRMRSIEPNPPFHFFNLGRNALERGDLKAAKALFAREVKRAPYYHEFHFWLAVTNWRLGEAEAARDELRLAAETSTTRDNSRRYSAKLAHLRGLKPVSSETY